MSPSRPLPSLDLVMSLTPGGMTAGRDTILRLLAFLGSPQNTLKVLHVTGSNGKGSVCQMISQVLSKQFHKKVGLFTSPHLIDITERFQINGVPISATRLDEYYRRVFELTKKYALELSFFEIQVVTMVLYFREENVDYAVVETGLGGLYDGTNIFEHPLACFITSITIEHSHILGTTRASVQRNKLGIVKKGTILYTHLKNKQVKNYCHTLGAKLGTRNSELGTLKLTNLPGKHQQKNALLVLQALTDLGFERQKVRRGLQHIYNPGRFEWISPNILVDTANNEQNIKILRQTLFANSELCPPRRRNSGLIILFGTTQIEPSYAAQLAHLIPAQRRILVDGFCERSLPCSQYAHLVDHDALWHLDSEDGIQKIRGILEDIDKETIYIIYGSIYLVGYIMGLSRYNIFANG